MHQAVAAHTCARERRRHRKLRWKPLLVQQAPDFNEICGFVFHMRSWPPGLIGYFAAKLAERNGLASKPNRRSCREQNHGGRGRPMPALQFGIPPWNGTNNLWRREDDVKQ